MPKENLIKKVIARASYEIGKLKPDYHKSFSQCGEDMIARYYLNRKKGFYVDIGAYHPKKISNTFYFYLRGWRGINIDGSKKAIALFKKARPKDINLNTCVGLTNEDAEIQFFHFKSPEINTFKAESLPEILKYHKQSPVSVETISLRSLESILDENLPKNQEIDLMTIDAEGADFEILLSNNWDLYRPKVIVIEKHCTIYEFLQSDMHQFLINKAYTLGGYCRHSYVFHKIDHDGF